MRSALLGCNMSGKGRDDSPEASDLGEFDVFAPARRRACGAKSFFNSVDRSIGWIPQSTKASTVIPSPFSLKAKLAKC
jgi:hypothetical protein